MSEREKFTQDIADKIREMRDWSAPYGILTGIQSEGRGKCRTISFGIARILDVSVKVFRQDYILLEAVGPLARESNLKFSSAQELLNFIQTRYVG